MTDGPLITLTPGPHPDAQIRRIGFTLDDPYVERCWASALGPSAVLLLRQASQLWAQATPVHLPARELAGMVGLGAGAGRHSRLHTTLKRLARYRFGAWDEPGVAMRVWDRVPPMPAHHLAQAPAWTRHEHERLLDAHLQRLAQPAATVVTDRLDLLQHSATASVPVLGR